MSAWYRGPIYEPKNSRFRPWSVITLISFLVGRLFGRWLRRSKNKESMTGEVMWWSKSKQTSSQVEQTVASKDTALKSEKKAGSWRYYEHDGALRAYANRAMIFAYISAATALLAVGFAAWVRLQPPLVFRVDASGNASMIGQTRPLAASVGAAPGSDTEPNELEKKAFMRLFLERYLNFSADSVNRSWSDALNMMTANLRRATLDAMQKDNIVGKVNDEQITSIFHLRSIEASQADPLSFTAYGTKEIHQVSDHHEAVSKMVGKYHIRLITERRTEENPSGLLIASYGEELIESEKADALAQDTVFTNSK